MIFPIILPIQIEVQYTPIFASRLSRVIVNSSVICIVISLTAILSNLIDYFINGYNNETSAVILIHVFFAVFVVFALLCLAGAMKRMLAFLKVGFILWVVLLVAWLSTCCIQFTSWYTVRDVCINNRCAESLWLSDFYYLGFEEVDEQFKNSTKPANNSTLEKLQSTTQKPPEISSRSKIPLKKNYLYITLFVLVFVSFFFFFIFLGSMIYSYHDALCYLSEEGQHVTVPHAAYIFIYPLRRFSEAGTSSGPAEVADGKNKEATDHQNKNKEGKTENQDKNKAEIKTD